jgi:hypothetical protein
LVGEFRPTNNPFRPVTAAAATTTVAADKAPLYKESLLATAPRIKQYHAANDRLLDHDCTRFLFATMPDNGFCGTSRTLKSATTCSECAILYPVANGMDVDDCAFA